MKTLLRICIGLLLCGTLVLVFWASRSSSPAFFPATSYVLPVPTTTPDITPADVVPAAAASATSSTFAFKSAMTTLFFAGEPADASNANIPNDVSYWDDAWQKNFGGADLPGNRCGYLPCAFHPLENPFYVALPYAEFDYLGRLKESAKRVPWYKDGVSPLLKNHWVKVVHDGHICFAQWEDVGPNGEDDFAYVFGSSIAPANTFDERAGLDVSPALWKCLGMTDNDITSWRFVDASEVPDGPWKETVTSSGINWGN